MTAIGLAELVYHTIAFAPGGSLTVFKDIWLKTITRGLSANHPIALFLAGRLEVERCNVEFAAALVTLGEAKCQIHQDSRRTKNDMASMRTPVARYFIDLNLEALVDRVMDGYLTSKADGCLAAMAEDHLCQIYGELGKSSYSKGKYALAVRYYRLADRFNTRQVVGRTINNLTQLAQSLSRTDRLAEAVEVVKDLHRLLRSKEDTLAFGGEADSVRVADNLKCLRKEFAQCADLIETIQYLRALKTSISQAVVAIGRPSSSEDVTWEQVHVRGPLESRG